MKLSQLLDYDNIIIQCHDNPDADALASGMGLLWYLKKHNKNVAFIYGGRFEIKKSNLILMVDELKIDVHYMNSQEEIAGLINLKEGALPDLLITVDCQYGEGNVKRFEAKNIAIIDHHQVSMQLPELSEVHSNQASCATVVWKLLKKEKLDPNEDINLATAFYYGLMTDSGNFTEIHHPLDMDMRDDLKFSQTDIIRFKNANISQKELRIAGTALINYEYFEKYHYAIVRTEPCDPNILGLISDMMLEVDSIDTCLVYSILNFGVKISVRSCAKESKANELADYLCHEVGDGGGHIVKAGGFIKRELLEQRGLHYEYDDVYDFLADRMKKYYEETDIIYARDYEACLDDMVLYSKKKFALGYVKATDLVPTGKKITVRTLEGDVDIDVKGETYIMIGLKGEIYPINEKTFSSGYELSDEPYEFTGEYKPSIKSIEDGKNIPILPAAKRCISTGNRIIYVKQLTRRVKVFTLWDEDKYYLGKPGDYLAVDKNDKNDVYIIEKDIFQKTYEKQM